MNDYIKTQEQRQRLPQILSLTELKGYFGDQKPEPKLTWWDVLKDRFSSKRKLQNLMDENTRLQAKVLSMQVQLQDTGRHGLNLFAENEALHILVSELKDQIKDPVKDLAGFVQNKEFWSNKYRETLKKLDELQWKHDGLLNSYNRILEDWSKLTGINNNDDRPQ